MAIIIKSPNSLKDIRGVSVFLAGTIDDGNSVDWQEMLVSEIHDLDITILNPRRSEWDASWVQSIDNPNFREQVEWELAALDAATYIFVYFAPRSYSPISLLELGLHASSGKIIAVCPDGFWKKGNVDVVGLKFGFPVFEDISSGLSYLKAKLV
jgi:hypothetical protein